MSDPLAEYEALRDRLREHMASAYQQAPGCRSCQFNAPRIIDGAKVERLAHDAIGDLLAQVRALTREQDEIARALGVAYEADGHSVQAAPLPVTLGRAEKLTREAWSWMELAQDRGAELERMRAAVEQLGHDIARSPAVNAIPFSKLVHALLTGEDMAVHYAHVNVSQARSAEQPGGGT